MGINHNPTYLLAIKTGHLKNHNSGMTDDSGGNHPKSLNRIKITPNTKKWNGRKPNKTLKEGIGRKSTQILKDGTINSTCKHPTQYCIFLCYILAAFWLCM